MMRTKHNHGFLTLISSGTVCQERETALRRYTRCLETCLTSRCVMRSAALLDGAQARIVALSGKLLRICKRTGKMDHCRDTGAKFNTNAK